MRLHHAAILIPVAITAAAGVAGVALGATTGCRSNYRGRCYGTDGGRELSAGARNTRFAIARRGDRSAVREQY
jgi:hypothetical protein